MGGREEGNHEFLVYVEDRDEPGDGTDRFWIEVHDKDRDVVSEMSMDRPADVNAVEVRGGNFVVPHSEEWARGGCKKNRPE